MNDAEVRAWVSEELLDPVAIPSPSEKEHEAVDHLEARCAAWGLPVDRLPAVHDEPFTSAEHPLLGRNVHGTLWSEGGGELHVVPDRARARIEIRVVPGGPAASTIEARLRALEAEHDADVELVEASVEPFETDASSPVLEALLWGSEEVTGSPAPTVGVPAWTDAHNFVELADAQAVVWGPGDFGLAHDAEEA
ncbi:MAG: hypothetical protein ACXWZF_02660, partial [Actinomycetota bacterium]